MRKTIGKITRTFSTALSASFFYSVPHFGSHLAETAAKARFVMFPSVEVRELRMWSPYLIALNDRFSTFKNISVLSFGETRKMQVLSHAYKTLVVPMESSNPGFGRFVPFAANHLDVCKPSARGDVRY
eukprot:Opistho-2@33271